MRVYITGTTQRERVGNRKDAVNRHKSLEKVKR